MTETVRKIVELSRQDRRFKFEAYAFVFEALQYAHKELGMGAAKRSDSGSRKKARPPSGQEEEATENHLTGQQLCEAIRIYALEQYGYMAKCVLNSWGVQSTGDFGEIVFNLIRIGEMRKTKEDRREDFDGVYDFEAALRQGFRIEQPK
ncbi:MAG TPA: Minf_1886 family protein [Pirellulales bacterium]|jgi:uncharacterized repeat protein (TIGR04138 family)|nr:Minf_1886 family protein [Pirellulales bacterium]